jgi:hypothetical protein
LLVSGAVGCSAYVGPVEQNVGSSSEALESDEVTLGPAGLNMNYYTCASEGGTCTIGLGQRYIAYGANGSYVYKLLGGSVSCSNATFGDPAVGFTKTCYFSNYGTSPGMPSTGLAQENQTATAVGNVAYGANGAFLFQTFNGSFTCSNATFGADPAVGVVKACYIAAPAYTWVATEGGQITGVVDNAVAFGAGGRFIYRIAGGPGTQNFTWQCSWGSQPDQFPYDPAPGLVKDCYKLTDGHLGAPTAQLMAEDGQQWTTLTNQSTYVFYGSGRNGNFAETTVAAQSGTCSAASAGGDPDPIGSKNCYNAPVPGSIQGRWTKIANDLPDPNAWGVESLSLMPDGTVLVEAEGAYNHWYQLNAGRIGGFLNATWTRVADSLYGRIDFPAAVLRDGRLLVCGGEYVFDQNGNQFPQDTDHNHCEIFDPSVGSTGSWTQAVDFPLANYFADGLLAPLPNGKILAATLGAGQSMEFDPAHATDSGAWTDAETAHNPENRPFCESALNQLQDDTILTAGLALDRYFPNASVGSKWGPIIPAAPQNPFGDVGCGGATGEGGAALTLYGGRALILAASSYNAVYTPRTNTSTNVARLPQVFPGTLNQGLFGMADENGQSVMPTGHVLAAIHSASWYDKFFDYDPFANAFADVSYGAPALLTETSNGGVVAQTPLPDGTVLVAMSGSKSLYVYSPPGAQLTSYGQPTITSVTGPVGDVYTLTGTSLNGLTNGADRDDEGSNYTSFPVISATSGFTTRYAVITSISSASIAPGAPVTVNFKAPRAGWPGHGAITLGVSASGLKSSNTMTITVP